MMHALGISLLCLIGPNPHDGPQHRIDALTRRMARHGRSAELLYQRALAYLELRKTKTALADLNEALETDPAHERVLVERVRVLHALDDPRSALSAVATAEKSVRETELRALVQRTGAEILTDVGRYEEALARVEASLRAVPEQVPVVLLASVLRGSLGRHEQRFRVLDAQRRRSIVLKIHPVLEAEWIDAALASGRAARVLPLIDERIAQCRFKSRWLIRRARARMLLRQTDGTDRDLLAALRELSSRVAPRRPDLLLLAERATALHMLGRAAASREDVQRLRRADYPKILQLRLQLTLGD